MYQYIETLEAGFPLMNFMATVPALNWLMRRHWVQQLTFPKPKDKTGMGKVKGYRSENFLLWQVAADDWQCCSRVDIPSIWPREGIQARHDAITYPARLYFARSSR